MSGRARLLVEIGCEEIPARMLDDAAAQVARVVVEQLDRAGLDHGEAHAYHTPRRLAVLVDEVARATPRREDLQLGPPAGVAWDADGRPTKAAEGFARRAGVAVDALERVTTDRGDYAGVRVVAGGRALGEVLADGFEERIARIPFPKSMRWGDGAWRFVRPVHWLVALADDEVLPLTLFGVRAGRTSRGHRALAPGPVEIPDAAAWRERLAAAWVVVDPAERRERLLAGLAREGESLGAEPVDDPELLDESGGLVEYPGMLSGRFDERFVDALPEEVLRTCLRHHQKAFVFRAGGRLAPAFAVAVGVPEDPAGHVRRGHEWVVGGRLDDALFFWTEDRRRPLADRREALAGVTFHQALGSYALKAERTVRLVDRIAAGLGHDDAQRATARRAAELARCDLVTGLVGEFPELQGVAGGLLAREDGEPEPVWRAIYAHYLPQGPDDPLPDGEVGRLVGLADRLDTIAGGFLAGLEPTGSRDPFAMRRAGSAAVRLAETFDALDLGAALDEAFDGYGPAGPGPDLSDRREPAGAAARAFLVDRFASLAERRGARYDEIAAVRAVVDRVGLVVADLFRRLEALAALRGSDDFHALAAASKRVRNILAQARERGEPVEPDQHAEALALPAERDLREGLAAAEATAQDAARRADHLAALRAVAALRPQVDRFFDEVLVMDDNPVLRRARLGLLARIHRLAHATADIAELVVEGNDR
ncbi:MAG: glycine--tRNA ligase subunit beta [Acidobacteria bacterium]|nr:MAG: glycine--tRNA ligase subunit beta [Acidobacteriota bacterium]